jgi:peptidoglycan/xylan/chitin deacetylase (PgdA/CDA1 family)
MYHELLAPGGRPARAGQGYARYVTATDVFRLHLECIRDCKLRGIALGTLLAPATPRAVVITFDDGCASDLVHAAPLLEEFGFSATFYLTVNWLGTPGFLSPLQVHELAGRGFEIGSHSLSHAYLADLDDPALRREIADSRGRLSEISGTDVRHLSCPGGRWSPRVAEVAREAGYVSVADSTPAAWSPHTDRFRIGRFPVTRNTKVTDIAQLAATGTWNQSGVASLVLRTAKTLLGNRRYDRLRSLILERGKD